MQLPAVQANYSSNGALNALTQDWLNKPSSWNDPDPCNWDGISCSNSHVTSIQFASMDLVGQLTTDIVLLSALQILDLSYNQGLTGNLPHNIGELTQLKSLILVGCGFSGSIPYSVGSLRQLVFLSLNSNSFTGNIPASVGNLSNLYWLDLSDNQLTGSIPVSNGTTPGLDMLVHTKHFHLGENRLSGTIPLDLFSSGMSLFHVLLDNNKLTGGIPSTLGLVRSLEVVRFDRNLLTGVAPSNLNNLTNLITLLLSNNKLTGSIPNLTGMSSLSYVDMSNNTFNTSVVPLWFSTLQSLETLMMEKTGLQGPIPATLFSFPQLQTVILKNNNLNDSLDVGSGYSSQLQLIDLQNNFISEFTPKQEYNFTLVLVGNPYCQETGTERMSTYCSLPQQSNALYSTPPSNCAPPVCASGQTSSPKCKCAYPYSGTLVFRAFYFSDLGNPMYYRSLEASLMNTSQLLSLPVDSVALSDAAEGSDGYLRILLEIFPAGHVSFNRTGISMLGFMLSNQTYKPSKDFGPFYFIAESYAGFAAEPARHKTSSHIVIIVAAAVGGSVLVLLVLSGLYAYHQKRRADRAAHYTHSFATSWDKNSEIPQLKGARWFSFEEINKYTNNFAEVNNIGSGGYGKVYKGVLANGQLVAIKRAQAGSMQGSMEFRTEIELLSRVHHKNLLNLLGFCSDQGEQMLVYEYLPNGNLLDSLSGKSGIRLDWIRRLRVALGSARGLAYLHELADPPIIHRDIKSNNILLDERLNAKVADFGLSKPFNDSEKGYLTTQVKGTLGYLDPEYYTTQQLTEKSDVYSFGVVMLELLTGRRPLQQGRNYIVKEVRIAIDKRKDLYGLHALIDPAIGSDTITLVGFEKFVDLAMGCVEDTSAGRPTMGEVVKGIEQIIQLARLNPNVDSAPTSTSYEGSSAGNIHQIYGDDSLCLYSGYITSPR
ncbi:hypothetical protein Ancab_039819 [Ancistrocladus abbreviatus]